MDNNTFISLKNVSFKSGFWSISNKCSNTFFSGILTLISTKYLNLKEYGQFIAIILIINFFIRIGEAAIPSYLIKIQKIKNDLLSTCFFFNIFNALFLISILNIFVSFFLDQSFTNQQFIICRILSILILTDSLSSLLYSTKERNFDIKIISFISIASEVISVLSAVFLFLNDYKIWALVNYMLVKSIIKLLLFILIFRFKLIFSLNIKYLSQIYSFLIPITLSSMLEYLSDEYIKISSSLLLSPADFGVLAISFKFLNTANTFYKTFNRSVFLPLLSSVKRINKENVLNLFLRLRYLVASFSFPIFSYLISSNLIVTKILLSSEWLESSKIIGLLAIGGFFIALRYIYYPYLIVKNKLEIKLFFPIIRIIVLSLCIYFFASLTLINFVTSFILVEFIISIISFVVISKIEGISFIKQIFDFYPLIFSSLISIITTKVFNNFLIFNSLPDLVFSFFINLIIFYSVFFLIDKKSTRDYKFIFKKFLFKNSN